jgi:hypothetical protein
MSYRPITALALAIAVSAPAAAQTRLAFSESNGVEVLAYGSPWCGETLDLEFRLSGPSPLRDTSALADFAPRLAPVFNGECPQARTARVRLTEPDGSAMSGAPRYTMSAARGWTIAPEQPGGEESGPGAADEAPAAAPIDLSAQFDQAAGFGDEDLLDIVFHFTPQFTDVERYPGVPLTVGAVYACQTQRSARGGDEFAQRRLTEEVAPRIDEHRNQGARVLGKTFRVNTNLLNGRYQLDLGEYDFDSEVFALEDAFGSQVGTILLSGQRGCSTSFNGSLPNQFVLEFEDDESLTAIPMTRDRAQALVSEYTRRRFSRVVSADALVTVTGFSVENGRGVIQVSPTALRLFEPMNGSEIAAFDASALEAARVAARERREAAEREARIAQRRATAQALEANRDREIEMFESQVETLPNRAYRILAAVGPEDISRPASDHPSLLAARAEQFGEPVSAVLMFRAGRNREDINEARWPAALRVEVRDNDFDGTLRSDDWYVAWGELEMDHDRADNAAGQLTPAFLEAEWIYACESDGCEDDADPDALVDAFTERLDARIEEALAELDETEEN